MGAESIPAGARDPFSLRNIVTRRAFVIVVMHAFIDGLLGLVDGMEDGHEVDSPGRKYGPTRTGLSDS